MIWDAKLIDFGTKDRQPAFTFDVSAQFLSLEGTYGFFPPNPGFYVTGTILLLLQGIISVGLAIIMHRFIIPYRGSPFAFLVGFGFIIPFAMYVPFYLVRLLDVRNKAFTLSLNNLPTCEIFRCLEAMYGTSPPASEESLSNYCLYNSCTAEFLFDSKTRQPLKIKTSDSLLRMKRSLYQILLFGVLISLTKPHGYEPFPSPYNLTSIDHSFFDLFYWGHLMNNFLNAALIYLTLSYSITLVGAIASFITGYQTLDAFYDPLFSSMTPTDFWGRRWNRLIQSLLKRGVFKPVRKYYSTPTAVLATFLASGLLHEYCWIVAFYVHDDEKTAEDGTCPSCHYPTHGKLLAFFLYSGILILLEFRLGRLWAFQSMKRTLPVFIIRMLVILTGLPVVHWFGGDWAKGGLYDDLTDGLPLVMKLH